MNNGNIITKLHKWKNQVQSMKKMKNSPIFTSRVELLACHWFNYLSMVNGLSIFLDPWMGGSGMFGTWGMFLKVQRLLIFWWLKQVGLMGSM